MSIFINVDDSNMGKNLFFAAIVCSVCMMVFVFSGCASTPAPAEEAPVRTVGEAVVIDDVWTLLARGQGDRARAFFMGEVGVNDTDSHGNTPLHLAALNKDSFLAAFFIALGARVDALDRENRTPLAISAEKGDASTARVLVNAGANIHHPMPGGSSPAHVGVRDGREFLSAIVSPASLASVNSQGRTILHIAAELGSPPAVNAILREEREVSRTDRTGRTALDIALERTDSRNHAEIAESLILAGAVSDLPLFTHFAPAVRSSNFNIRSADGMAPLHFIARGGYMGYLAFVLERNANVNIQNASGATPLHEAGRSGNLMFMQTLLRNGADVNSQDANGNTPLHIAFPPEIHLDALRLFISRGANLNLRDEHGSSPLHIAIILNRSDEIVRTLLRSGSDHNIRDMEGRTPLYIAVERNRTNHIPLLLAHNADIFAADNNGITPFEKALNVNPAIVFSLITPQTVTQNDSAGNTMLHIAVASGGNNGTNISVINHILGFNAPVNARNMAGDTSLTIAVRYNKEVAGTLLLNNGADIFAANANGESPLFLTFPPSGRGITELRQWMLTPQTLNARDGLGNTALHYLAQWRFDAWIPMLIQMGARTEAANATGETPLFFAVRQDSPSTIRVLIDNGAMLVARDTLGNSALHAAVRWQAVNGAETLLDLGLDINSHALNGKTPLHDSIRLGISDIELLLVWRGADIEARDADGNTPFMEAVMAGNMPSMERLVRNGADTNVRNFRGDTALHLSADIGGTDLSSVLLGWGASIHARNARGRTPLQNALGGSSAQLRIFLANNRVNSSDDNGSSPLHIAVAERSSLENIRTILEMGGRLSSVDSEGRTPLRLAVELNSWGTAQFLADSGADVFIAARDGRNAAEVALNNGDTAVRALFSGRAINSRDASGNTVLHYAARHGDTEIISLLLSLGAQRQVRNIAAESPAEIALRWRHNEAAVLLN